MSPRIATIVFVFGILGLFWLDRDDKPRSSKALWVPIAWLFINSSRAPSLWLSAIGLLHAAPRSFGSQFDMYLEGNPIDGAFYQLVLFAGLFILGTRLHRASTFLRQNWLTIAFFLYCFLSILWSAFPWITFKHWNKGIGDVVVALLVLTEPEPGVALRRLFTRIGFVLIPLSVLFARYLPDLGRSYTYGGEPMTIGVGEGKNGLGILCLIMGLYFSWSLLAWWRDRSATGRARHLIAHIVIVAMVAYLLRLCDSMTSISCFSMAGAIMILTSQWKLFRRHWVVHSLLAATVCFSSFALFFDNSGSLLKQVGRNPTLTGRTEIWSAVIPMVKNPVLGTGYESFWLGDRLEEFWRLQDGLFKGINEAHNGYIEIYLNLGWIGVLLLAGILITGYRQILDRFHDEPQTASLGVAFLAATVIYNFTEAGFRMMNPLWILFLLAILGVPKVALTVTGGSLKGERLRNIATDPDLTARRRLHWSNI